jgi:hypothetical protein
LVHIVAAFLCGLGIYNAVFLARQRAVLQAAKKGQKRHAVTLRLYLSSWEKVDDGCAAYPGLLRLCATWPRKQATIDVMKNP